MRPAVILLDPADAALVDAWRATARDSNGDPSPSMTRSEAVAVLIRGTLPDLLDGSFAVADG